METNPLLAGTRVLDLSRLLPGPFCTLYLAQMGAEVIKIEEPNIGDYCRVLSPELFAQVNRGKKSVTLDLKQVDDVARLKALVAEADVLIESFRPGVMDKLGCGYEVLKAINPRLVYASLTGYGQTGPYAKRPGHDINYRAYTGELHQTGVADGDPAAGAFQVADLAGGALTCAIGILGALVGAQRSGIGTFVDVSMMDGTLALQVMTLATQRVIGAPLERGCDMLTGALPNYRIYRCADDRYIAVGAVEYKFFVQICLTAERPDLMQLAAAPGKAGEPLREALAALFLTQPRNYWEAKMAALDTCVTSVLDPAEALQNEQVKARGMVLDDGGKPAFDLPIRFSDGHVRVGRAPGLGADNQSILTALQNQASA
ncbi:CaiB/BaiF CoA-transferase family protein [Pseudomonas sp. NFIX28]|uniref:CaiB/BaiF CoA transferase family protein n=1 Tax=Pseudomonas sp. NFIX28 TaxID=1566235 RepID=UPI0008974218|nr:CaiB/BaiF CoA-transferase family protein [Pseudomonas sp. NFIX28]SDY43729.1 Crotonobetainyl-CoA:carnitine CoA-transferase CaiB [Pseudomonas sp. NFIX28]